MQVQHNNPVYIPVSAEALSYINTISATFAVKDFFCRIWEGKDHRPHSSAFQNKRMQSFIATKHLHPFSISLFPTWALRGSPQEETWMLVDVFSAWWMPPPNYIRRKRSYLILSWLPKQQKHTSMYHTVCHREREENAERERKRERKTQRERERKRQREREREREREKGAASSCFHTSALAELVNFSCGRLALR